MQTRSSLQRKKSQEERSDVNEIRNEKATEYTMKGK